MSNTDYDVCIVGAGAAGIFAAYAFIDSDYSVCLIDKQPNIGGTFANAWVNNWIPEPNIPPFKELYDTLHTPPYQVYGDYAKSWMHAAFSKSGGESGLAFSFDGEALLAFLKQKFELNKNIDVCLNTELISAASSGGNISSVKVRTDYGIRHITARFFVDATGNAVLCRYAGFPVVIGAEPQSTYGESLAPDSYKPDALNMPSLMYALTTNPDEAEDLTSVEVSDSVSFDGYICIDGVTGKVFVNPLSGLGVSGRCAADNYDEAYRLSIERRKQHWKKVRDELEKMSQQGVSDDTAWKGWKVGQRKYFLSKNYAPMLGVRETYRVKCKKMLTQNDLTKQITKDTTITQHFVACGNHDVDIHGGGSQEIINFNRNELRPYGVPLECFIPENSCNTFVAGRCAGFSHIAAASFRINKSAAQGGWAVGNAIRLMCDTDKVNIQNIDDAFVSDLLSENYTGFLHTVEYLEENVL